MAYKLVDDSHKYTTVKCDAQLGPGGAHHHYVVTKKDGSKLAVLNFQNGPIKEAGEVNGVMNEDLIAIVIDRLEGFQAGPYACQDNQDALDALKMALGSLQNRTSTREAQGIEGTNAIGTESSDYKPTGEWKMYRKTALQEMRPYVPGEDLSGISVNQQDTPAEGGMIARNAKDPLDMWYVAEQFFKDNYEPA